MLFLNILSIKQLLCLVIMSKLATRISEISWDILAANPKKHSSLLRKLSNLSERNWQRPKKSGGAFLLIQQVQRFDDAFLRIFQSRSFAGKTSDLLVVF